MTFYSTRHIPRELPPKAPFHILLVLGLAFLVYAIVTQQLLLAVSVIGFPIAIMMIGYGLSKPHFTYLIYATYAFSFIAISRYIYKDKLSVGLDIILVFLFISILFANYNKKSNLRLKDAFNVLTLSYVVWIVYILFQLSNSGIKSQGMTEGVRVWILRTCILYIVASVVSNTPKMLRNGLIAVGIFTIISFTKTLYQRFIGFDDAEKYWLYVQDGARTHIISSGIRYFSFFSDAANYGTIMGALILIYSIAGFNAKHKRMSLFYFNIAIMAMVGLFLSGTRGSLAVPLAGLALYCLISRSAKIFSITAVLSIGIFVFFTFTDIGNGNQFIRRARTAFRPTEDASYIVRIENRKEIAAYLKKHPLGVGISENIPKLWRQGEKYVEGTLPPDSFFVSIWIQTGLIGLILYISIYIVVILRCCYIVMFKVHSKRLRQILAALTCATFGILVSGYTANSPGQPPTDFLIVAMIAFVMNGAYIDKQNFQQKII